MIQKTLLLLLLAFFINFSNAQNTVMLDSTELTVDTIVGKLDVPWEIVWGPDKHIWFTERFGKISRVNPATKERKVILDYRSKVYQFNESGMLGLFLHPDFSTKPFVYVAYTYLQSSVVKERISRFTYANDSLTNEEILVDNIPGNTTHIGCRFLLLPDKTLIFTTGDAQKSNDSQNPTALNGKILRMTLDGAIPADNPNTNSYVWTWGLRNTQGLTFGPHNIIYASEHGPTNDDELNILTKGRNFGWPTVQGKCNSAPEIQFCKDSNVVEPIFTWTPTIAPSDLIYYTHHAIPEFQNTLVMTVLKNKTLTVFKLSEDGSEVSSTKNYLSQEFGRLRDICTDEAGNIYLATNGRDWSNSDPNTHVILRLKNERKVSVINLDLNNQFSFYPNPSNGKFMSLNIPTALLDGNIDLMDIHGKVVDHIALNLSSKTITYNNPNLASGVYFLRYQGNGLVLTERWIVK